MELKELKKFKPYVLWINFKLKIPSEAFAKNSSKKANGFNFFNFLFNHFLFSLDSRL